MDYLIHEIVHVSMFICKQPSGNRSSYGSMAHCPFILATQCEWEVMSYLSYVCSCDNLPLSFSHEVLSPAITVAENTRTIVCKTLVLLPCTPMLPRSERSYSPCPLFTPNNAMPQYCKTLSTTHSPVPLRYPTAACVLSHILRTLRNTPSRLRIPHAWLRTTSILP